MKCEYYGKCIMPDELKIKPDGTNELGPCICETIEQYGNITVTISKCIKCGHIDIPWQKQDDTIDLIIKVNSLTLG